MSDRIQSHRKSTTANAESSKANSLSPPSFQAAVVPAPTPSIAPTSTESDTASASETTLDPAQRSPYAYPGHDFSRISIQPKLTVSQPDDPLEREADQVAERVMRMPEPVSSAPAATGFVGHDFSQIAVLPHLQPGQSRSPLEPEVQRQSKAGSFNAVSRSSTQPYIGHGFGQISIQPQRMVSRSPYPNSLNRDWVEETGGDGNAELPNLAASVTPLVQRVALPEDDAETEGVEPETSPEAGAELELPIEAESPDSDSEAEDELVQTKPLLQRAASGQAKGTDAGASLEQRLAQSQGTGSPLADETRGFMESRFGADFGSVRAHTDSSAVQLNKDLNAQAFTQGSDVYFGAGKSPGKNDLTAHELTHTIQQTGGLQAKTLSRRSNQDQASKYHLPIHPNLNLSTLQRREAPPSSPETQTPPDSDDSKSTEPPAPGSQDSPAPTSPPTLTDAATPAAEKPGTATAPPPGESKPEAPPKPEATAPTDSATEAGTAPVAAAPAAGTATPKGAIEPSAAVPASEQAAVTGKTAIGQAAAPGTTLPGSVSMTGGQPVFDSHPTVSSNAQDPGQILDQLINTPPTQASATYTQSQSASTQALESQRQQVQATLPEIPAPTGLPAQTSVDGNVGQITENASVAKDRIVEKASIEQLGQTVSPQPAMPLEQPEGNAPGQGLFNPLLSLPAQFGSSSMPGGSNGEVSTSAGERPKVNLTGDADPSQMNTEQAQSGQQVQSAKTQAAGGIHQDYGENGIFPKARNETLKANKELSRVAPPQGEVGTIPALSPDVAGRLDQGLTPFYREKVGAEQNKYHVGKEKFDVDSTQARADSSREVAHLNQETQQKQLEAQKQARQETDQSRQAWQAELDHVEQDYQEKAGKATQEQREKIDQEKAKGEEKADQHLKEAEQKAEEEKKKADDEARKKEEEAKKPKSFWEEVGNVFSSIWEGIKSAVNAIYDAVRQVVKGIFDAVKKLVNTVIDLARQAIVGLIKVFGEVLKGLVQVIFAAFPEISKKFTDLIDQAVNKATEAVNAAADFLQKAISSVLDFLANTLDKLLSLAQDLWKGIFTVIGMIITGQFEELIKRFDNLIKGGEAMPPQFETAGIEELMGGDVDLDKPLAPEELAQAQQAGVNIPNQAGEDTHQADEAEELPSQPWTEDNVGVDAVEQDMELSPEVTDELVQQTNGEGEVLLAESDDQSRSMDTIMSEATGGQQTGGEQEPQIPDDGLTPKQRASVKWELMKEGIKKWFSDNWPILLAALIAAAAVIIAAIVASGGAVLAALPILLDILTVVFAADTIAKIGGYLRDYLSKSWEGDIQGGGKSLAKALAAGAIELIMLLTFEAGKVASKGAKAAAEAAKAAAKGAMKVFRGVIKGIKYIIQKGKVLFKGLAETGIGKQFKRLKDLGKGLLDRMRFKAFRIRVANGWFRLEGLINPWVLIAEGKIRKAQQNTEGAVEVTDDELSELLAKTGEKTLPKLKSYEQARNKAFEFLGDFSPREPYIGTMNSSYGKGKVVGYQSADKKVRLRLDYDPNKGPHFNLEDFRAGKGDKAIKIAIPFEGNEQTVKTYIDLINDKWNGSLF